MTVPTIWPQPRSSPGAAWVTRNPCLQIHTHPQKCLGTGLGHSSSHAEVLSPHTTIHLRITKKSYDISVYIISIATGCSGAPCSATQQTLVCTGIPYKLLTIFWRWKWQTAPGYVSQQHCTQGTHTAESIYVRSFLPANIWLCITAD